MSYVASTVANHLTMGVEPPSGTGPSPGADSAAYHRVRSHSRGQGATSSFLGLWACIGYLDHPFEKEALGLSPLASFSWSSEDSAIEIAGKSFSVPEKTRVYGQQTIREGMHRLAGEGCHRPLQA